MRVGVFSCRGQALAFAAILLLGACKRGPEELPLVPPATPPLSRPIIGYGVIGSSYIHVQNEPGRDSVSLGYLRRGSVAEVVERRIMGAQGAAESWIRVNGAYRGWIREEGVRIYANKAQAATASESLSGPEPR